MCEAALVAQTSPRRSAPRRSGSTSSIRIGMMHAAVATGDDDIPSRCGGRSGALRAVAIECWKMGSWRSNPTAGAPREWLSTRPTIFLGRLEVSRAESNDARAPTAPRAPHSHTTHRTPTGGCSRRYRPGWARRGTYGPARWSPVLGVRASRAARLREGHGGSGGRGAHPRCQSASPSGVVCDFVVSKKYWINPVAAALSGLRGNANQWREGLAWPPKAFA